MSTSVCRCEEQGIPLCGFCRDDLFCPQCGSEITSVSSDDAYRGENVIWVFADDGGAFEFSLSLECHDFDRSSQHGLPDLDLNKSKLGANPWFDSKLAPVGQRHDGQAMRYRLQPQAGKGRLPANLANQLPPEGVEVQLFAEGGFRSQSFTLHVCRKPAFYLKFTGYGALPSQDDEKQVCDIWRRDELPLSAQIICPAAPLKLKAEALVTLNGVAGRIENIVPAGELLKTGDSGRAFGLTVNTKNWQEGDEGRSLAVTLSPCGTDELHVEYQFNYIELGDLEFSCGKRLAFPDMYVGESQSKTIKVTNVGTQTVNLYPPEKSLLQPATDDWLRITLPGNHYPNEMFSLGTGESFDIIVDLDLSKQSVSPTVRKQDYQAEIALSDDLRRWTIQIRALDVTERPQEAIRWLAIDFGSTNTYAAMANNLGGNAPPIAALFRPGSEQAAETYTTAIFFYDVASRPPKYEIGPNAITFGEASPLALATGFKRAIGIENGKLWHVTDDKNQEAKFDAATLMKLFLRKVIERCDEEQRIRVSKVGLSFPANLDQTRVRAMEQVLASLEQELRTAAPPRLISIDPPRLDEATAVALSFALAPEFLYGPVNDAAASSSVVIASFDFGGGTIDTALLRLTFRGKNRRFAPIESEHLGIGGDEFCGGENVTLAVVEVMIDRILALLTAAETEIAGAGPQLGEAQRKLLEIPIAGPGEGHSKVERRNYDLLWTAAETWKIHLCRSALQSGESASPPAVAETMAAEATASAAVLLQGVAAAKALEPSATVNVPASEASDPLTELPREVREKLSAALERLEGRFENSAKKRFEARLFESAENRKLLETFILTGQILPHLPDIYQHRIRKELGGTPHGTIQDRVKACITELSSYVERANVPVDYLILAGASSRLPLVRELLRQDARLRDVKIVFDSEHAKSKVAHGLIRYLDLRENAPHRVAKVRGPLHYVPYPIGFWDFNSRLLCEIIPECAPLAETDGGGRWYRYAEEATAYDFLSDHEQLRIDLHTVEQKKLGSIDLLDSADRPVKRQDLYELYLELRLGPDVNVIFARLVDRTGSFASGPWQMKPV